MSGQKAEPLSDFDRIRLGILLATLFWDEVATVVREAGHRELNDLIAELVAAKLAIEARDRSHAELERAHERLADDLAAATARAEGAERETIAKVVAWLRDTRRLMRLPIRSFPTNLAERIADSLESGTWKDL